MVAEIMFPPARPTRAFVGTARSVGLAVPAVALALIVLAGISASLAFVIESSATPAPGGTAHSPSARRKLVVPPLPAVWASARKPVGGQGAPAGGQGRNYKLPPC